MIQAATFRLLKLIGELDRRGGWTVPLECGGFRSSAHWLSWHLSLGLGAARQYVRVARALPELPAISEAFSRGELSYSKVRALTRVANEDNEPMLLEWARAGTAAQVENLVRRYRSADRQQENEQATAQQARRELKAYFDDDGMLVLRGRLAPEQGALLLKALEVSREALLTPPDGSAEPETDSAKPPKTNNDDSPVAADQVLADALTRVAERALDADRAGASPAAADRFQVVMHVDAEVLADPEADGRCELADGPGLAADTARRLTCDASVCELTHGAGGDLIPGRKRRFVTAPLRRALQARDGTRCAFPGCGCRGRDAHHLRHWADGGPTTLSNLLSLCKFHHVLLHEGGYRVEARDGGSFRFLDARGRELAASAPVPAVSDDPETTLAQRWLPEGLALGPDSGRPGWPDEPCDYDWAVESLQLRAAQGTQ